MKFLFKLYLLAFILFTSIYSQDGLVKEYYNNGNLKSEINYVDGVRIGEARFYNENGSIKRELNYENGKVEGLVKVYTDKGILTESFVIEEGRRNGPTSLYDSTGTYLTDISFEEGRLVREKDPFEISQPKDKKELASNDNNPEVVEKKEPPKDVRKNVYQYDFPLPPEIKEEKVMEDDPAFYTNVEVKPTPVKGKDAIYNYLYYPKKARENDIEGTVEILTLFDKFGNIIEAKVQKGIGYGCDDAARLAVLYTEFEPGLLRGVPVKVQMVIPVEFKLEN